MQPTISPDGERSGPRCISKSRFLCRYSKCDVAPLSALNMLRNGRGMRVLAFQVFVKRLAHQFSWLDSCVAKFRAPVRGDSPGSGPWSIGLRAVALEGVATPRPRPSPPRASLSSAQSPGPRRFSRSCLAPLAASPSPGFWLHLCAGVPQARSMQSFLRVPCAGILRKVVLRRGAASASAAPQSFPLRNIRTTGPRPRSRSGSCRRAQTTQVRLRSKTEWWRAGAGAASWAAFVPGVLSERGRRSIMEGLFPVGERSGQAGQLRETESYNRPTLAAEPKIARHSLWQACRKGQYTGAV